MSGRPRPRFSDLECKYADHNMVLVSLNLNVRMRVAMENGIQEQRIRD